MNEMRATISKSLIRLRERENLTQSEMSERIGVALRTYQGYEGQERFPKADVIQKICEEFGTTKAELFQDKDAEVKDFPVSELIRKLSAIPDEVYNLAMKLGANNPMWKEEIIPLLEAAVDDLQNQKKNRQA